MWSLWLTKCAEIFTKCFFGEDPFIDIIRSTYYSALKETLVTDAHIWSSHPLILTFSPQWSIYLAGSENPSYISDIRRDNIRKWSVYVLLLPDKYPFKQQIDRYISFISAVTKCNVTLSFIILETLPGGHYLDIFISAFKLSLHEVMHRIVISMYSHICPEQ